MIHMNIRQQPRRAYEQRAGVETGSGLPFWCEFGMGFLFGGLGEGEKAAGEWNRHMVGVRR